MFELQVIRSTATVAMAIGIALTTSTASIQMSDSTDAGNEVFFAQTQGMDNRQDRRQDRRGDRQDCRQVEGVVGNDKRDCKQGERQDRNNTSGSTSDNG